MEVASWSGGSREVGGGGGGGASLTRSLLQLTDLGDEMEGGGGGGWTSLGSILGYGAYSIDGPLLPAPGPVPSSGEAEAVFWPE